ncbi:MAG: DUF1413 domain-containing protein [Ruminococcus sp.]|nr:DUF1413 domain-containing protein [Ruminococcus sp.]
MNNFEWLEKAKNRINTLPVGTTFEVKELFDSIEWGELSAKERQSFGRYFSSNYNDGQINNICRVDDGRRGPNKYIKE